LQQQLDNLVQKQVVIKQLFASALAVRDYAAAAAR
jgi:hypothetical protein